MYRKWMDRQSRYNNRHRGKSHSLAATLTVCLVEPSIGEAAGNLRVQFERKRSLSESRRARDHRLDSRRRQEAAGRRGGPSSGTQKEHPAGTRSTR